MSEVLTLTGDADLAVRLRGPGDPGCPADVEHFFHEDKPVAQRCCGRCAAGSAHRGLSGIGLDVIASGGQFMDSAAVVGGCDALDAHQGPAT
ncbi:MAG: hypothetical protein ACRDTT_04975 [Pseudonocardiaceae bacterium]